MEGGYLFLSFVLTSTKNQDCLKNYCPYQNKDRLVHVTFLILVAHLVMRIIYRNDSNESLRLSSLVKMDILLETFAAACANQL